MKVFVYCSEGIGYICDTTDEVDLEEFPFQYAIKEESSEDRPALLEQPTIHR